MRCLSLYLGQPLWETFCHHAEWHTCWISQVCLSMTETIYLWRINPPRHIRFEIILPSSLCSILLRSRVHLSRRSHIPPDFVSEHLLMSATMQHSIRPHNLWSWWAPPDTINQSVTAPFPLSLNDWVTFHFTLLADFRPLLVYPCSSTRLWK